MAWHVPVFGGIPRQKKENSLWVSDGAIPPPYSASSAVWRHTLSLRKPGCQFSAAPHRLVSGPSQLHTCSSTSAYFQICRRAVWSKFQHGAPLLQPTSRKNNSFVCWRCNKRTEDERSDGPSTWMPQMIGCISRLNRDGGIGEESVPHRGGLQKSISMSWSCERFWRERRGVFGIRRILGLEGLCSWIPPSSWLPSPKAGPAHDGWAHSSRESTR